MSRHTTGSLLIAGSALSWGVIPVMVRELTLPALTIVFFRVALSAAAVAAILAVTGRRDLLRPPAATVPALGLVLAVHWGLYFSAIKETSVASAVLITYAAPIFIALIAPALLRERVPPLTIAALAVSLGGIAAISLAGGHGGDAVRPLGVVLALGAAVSYAVLIVLIKRWAAAIDPLTVVVYQDATAAAVLSPALLFTSFGGLDAVGVGYLLALGVLLTGVVGALYIAALRWVPATTAGILAYMEPVSAALVAAALLGQRLTATVIGGGLAIVAAGVTVAFASPQPIAAAIEEPVPVGPAAGVSGG
ncbi:MAG: drug/metabolite transporter, family [Solirubrobacteraceae bacterium]|jgi:DME family drug/metabolite transporter|nr:drug/metabolite transporter, family [Solirubrobacteraceae bacterium]